MDKNSVCLCVLVLVLFFELGHSDSPCSDIFDFYTDGRSVYGKITLEPVETVSSLQIRISYTVQADLDDDLGSIVTPDDVLDKYNRGETVNYRVNFPVTNPRPKVTEIALNGEIICTGPGDKASNGVISNPTLQVSNSYGVGGPPSYRRFQHQPQTIVAPQLIQHISNDYTSGFTQNINDRFGISDSASSSFQSFTDDSRHSFFDDARRKFLKDTRRQFFDDPEREFFDNSQHSLIDDFFARQSGGDWISKVAQPTVKPSPPKVQQQTQQPRPVQRYSPSTTTDECGVISGGNQIQQLIHRGMSYERGQIPWLVAIFKTKRKGLEFICGGTLVSDRHVVTAAHCKQSRSSSTNNGDIVVKLGIHDLNDWSDDFTVTTKILNATIHESYDSSQSLENDIMVLTLNKRVKFNRYIRPACLWSGDAELSHVVGDTGVVAGWGDRDNNVNQIEEPQLVRVPIVSTKDCRASNSFFHQVTYNTTLCAGDRNGAGPCAGDSGGGLYLKEGGKWRLRGIVSLALQGDSGGRTCNLIEYVVFTDSAQYLPWIRNILSHKYFD